MGGVVSAVTKAVTAPITSTVAAVSQVAQGNVGGAIAAAIGGAKDVASPVVQSGKAYFIDAPSNFVSGAVSAGKGVAAGDWGMAGKGFTRAGLSGTNIATFEGGVANAFNDGNVISPTGYGAIAYDQDADAAAYRRALATTAIIAGGAYASGGLGAGAGGTASGTAAAGGGTTVGGSAGAPLVAGIIKTAVGGGSASANRTLAATGVATEEKTYFGLSEKEAIAVAAVVVAIYLIHKSRK